MNAKLLPSARWFVFLMRGVALAAVLQFATAARAETPEEALWTAARTGDIKQVEALLAKKVNVNATTDYGASALWFAAYKGRSDVIAMLLKHGADPNVRDKLWGETPLSMAAQESALDGIRALLAAGARQADLCLIAAVGEKNDKVVEVLLEKGALSPEAKAAAVAAAPADATAVVSLLHKFGGKPLTPIASALGGKELAALEGSFDSQQGQTVKVRVKDGLVLTESRPGSIIFRPSGPDTLTAIVGGPATLTVRHPAGKPVGVTLKTDKEEYVCERTDAIRLPTVSAPRREETRIEVVAPQDWPSFRGRGAGGTADGQHPPTVWDVDKGLNLRWKTPIPGVGHSCPIVLGDRVFVTTAVSSDPKAAFKTGQYGGGASSKDLSVHSWRVYCLDKKTGKVLWEREAHKGVPRVDRHEKSSQASATPAGDGKSIVAVFGSEGLYCYDLDGNLKWHQDLGVLDLGAFNDPDLKWGAGSSPAIYKNLVIVQCDRPKDGFLAAYDLATGKPVWRTARNEVPSWGTPTVIDGPSRAELVVNGGHFIRGYDPATGKELWRLGPNSEIAVPTPFTAAGLIFVTSGYRPIQPIYALVPGASGDISRGDHKDAGPYVAWQTTKGGPYLPTPIVYGSQLYVCTNQGILTAYDARTGRQVYKNRLGGGGGYTASPVAADGKLYFTCEDGEVRVVKAGSQFDLLAINPIGEACLATPAIADGMIFVRGRNTLFAFGGRSATSPPHKP